MDEHKGLEATLDLKEHDGYHGDSTAFMNNIDNYRAGCDIVQRCPIRPSFSKGKAMLSTLTRVSWHDFES